jgi:hypothetical protein
MTQRITVSLPDDVAERVAQASNASAFITTALRERIEREDTRALLAEHGFQLTEEGRQRARGRLAAVRAGMTPESYAHLREVGREAGRDISGEAA